MPPPGCPQARSTVGPGSVGERPHCAGSLTRPGPALGTHRSLPARDTHAGKEAHGAGLLPWPREELQPRDTACAGTHENFSAECFLGKIKKRLVRMLPLLEWPAALSAERQ